MGEKNRNNRIYEKEVWDKVLADTDIQEKLKNRSLFFHAEHPDVTQSNTEKVAGVVSDMTMDEKKVYATMEVLDTPYGRIVDTLLRAGCGIGVSTRADGELEEALDEDGNKYSRVIPESYRFVTVDFTADPSSYGSEMPIEVQRGVTKVVKSSLDNESMDRSYATVLLEHMNISEAKTVLESMKIDKHHKACKCKPTEKKCLNCNHANEDVELPEPKPTIWNAGKEVTFLKRVSDKDWDRGDNNYNLPYVVLHHGSYHDVYESITEKKCPKCDSEMQQGAPHSGNPKEAQWECRCGNIVTESINEMNKLGVRLYGLLSMSIKTSGSYAPDEVLPMIEEELTPAEYDELKGFLQWVTDNNKRFGSGNYEQMFSRYKGGIGESKIKEGTVKVGDRVRVENLNGLGSYEKSIPVGSIGRVVNVDTSRVTEEEAWQSKEFKDAYQGAMEEFDNEDTALSYAKDYSCHLIKDEDTYDMEFDTSEGKKMMTDIYARVLGRSIVLVDESVNEKGDKKEKVGSYEVELWDGREGDEKFFVIVSKYTNKGKHEQERFELADLEAAQKRFNSEVEKVRGLDEEIEDRPKGKNESYESDIKRYRKMADEYFSGINIIPDGDDIVGYIADQVEDASGAEVDQAGYRKIAKMIGVQLDEESVDASSVSDKEAKRELAGSMTQANALAQNAQGQLPVTGESVKEMLEGKTPEELKKVVKDYYKEVTTPQGEVDEPMTREEALKHISDVTSRSVAEIEKILKEDVSMLIPSEAQINMFLSDNWSQFLSDQDAVDNLVRTFKLTAQKAKEYVDKTAEGKGRISATYQMESKLRAEKAKLSENYVKDAIFYGTKIKELKDNISGLQDGVTGLKEKVVESAETIKVMTMKNRKLSEQLTEVSKMNRELTEDIKESKAKLELETAHLKVLHEKALVKMYKETKIKCMGLRLSEQCLTILESCKTPEEVDRSIRRFQEAFTEGAFHSSGITGIEVTERVALDPKQVEIDVKVEKAMSAWTGKPTKIIKEN